MGYFAAMALLKNLQEAYSKPDSSDVSDLTFADLEQLVEGEDDALPAKAEAEPTPNHLPQERQRQRKRSRSTRSIWSKLKRIFK